MQQQRNRRQSNRRDRATGYLEPLEGRLCMASVTLASDSFGTLALDSISSISSGNFTIISGRLGNGSTVTFRGEPGTTVGLTDASNGQVLITYYGTSLDSATSQWSGQLVLDRAWVHVNSAGAYTTTSGSTSNLASASTKKKTRAPKVVQELPTESRRGEHAGAHEQQASAVVSATEAPDGFAIWSDVEESTLASSFFASANDHADNTFVAAAPVDARGGMLGSADSSAATTSATGSLVQQFLAAGAAGATRNSISAFASFSSRVIAVDLAAPVADLARVGVDLSAALKAVVSAATAIRAVPPAVAATTGAQVVTATIVTVPPRVFGYTHLNLPYTMLADSLAAFVDESATVTAGSFITPQRVDPPWALTFGVFAADLVALAYIHRAKLKTRLLAFASPADDEVDPSLAPVPVT